MSRTLIAAISLILVTGYSFAASITVRTGNAGAHTVNYKNNTLRNKGVALDSGTLLSYSTIETISTAEFRAYEKAVDKTSRKANQHVKVIYTGSENIDALRLEELERKRKGAGIARGAGGAMMLLGILAGDRALTAAGLATYGGGTVARDLNTENTIAAQNEAIRNLQQQQQALDSAEDLEAQFRIEYGNESVDGLIALADKDYPRAMSLANAGGTSQDGNHRLASSWLKALIYADQKDQKGLQSEYEKLVVLDPEVKTAADAEGYMVDLQADLTEFRKECSPAAKCAEG